MVAPIPYYEGYFSKITSLADGTFSRRHLTKRLFLPIDPKKVVNKAEKIAIAARFSAR